MRPCVVCLCVLGVLLLAVHNSQSQPVKFQKWEDYLEAMGKEFTQKEDKCKNDPESQNICEKCSKVTKNEVVFPLCCQEQKGVRTWCKKFLSYTYKE